MQEKYDDIETTIANIDMTIDELGVLKGDYEDTLLEIKFELQTELEKVEQVLSKEQEQEEKEQMNEYIRSVM